MDTDALDAIEDVSLFDNSDERCWFPDDVGYEEHRRKVHRVEGKALRHWARACKQRPLQDVVAQARRPKRIARPSRVRRRARAPRSRVASVRARRGASVANARDGDPDGGEPPPWRQQQVHRGKRHKRGDDQQLAVSRRIAANDHSARDTAHFGARDFNIGDEPRCFQ